VATQKYVSENYGRGDLDAAASVSRLSFTIVEEGDLEPLRKALPHQLKKILKMLEGFIIHEALALAEKTYLTLH